MRDEAVELLRDSVYVTVGFGVLAVQRLQVRRRELERLVARSVPRPGAPGPAGAPPGTGPAAERG